VSQECCATNGGNIMLLACSGGSNVGQLSNRVSVELTQEGFGKMFCLAGIGAHLSGFVHSAKDVPQMVVIDRCNIGCAKAILEHAQVPLKVYLVITDLGIKKNHDFGLKDDEIALVKEAVKKACAGAVLGSQEAHADPGSCCS